MSGYITCVKGGSGSGKSTRVYLLYRYLLFLGYITEDFLYTNTDDKCCSVGRYFPELELVILGKLYGEGRFQGYDAVTKRFQSSEHFSSFLLDNSDRYSFIVEGAGVTLTYRLRPLYLQELGFDNIYLQYYNFADDQKQNYKDRILLRSGKYPNKDSMWRKCSSFNRECSKAVLEAEHVDSNCMVMWDPYDANDFDFGEKYLRFTGYDSCVVTDFVEFCVVEGVH